MPEYYTEENIVKEPFLFVSYKHDDKEIVHNSIKWLIGEGVRVWYDADLHNGDNWIEIAERIITNDNCIGVIFFNSAAAYTSAPVAAERAISLKKRSEWEEAGKRFHIFVVNIGKPSTMRIIKQVFDSLSDTDEAIGNAISSEELMVILQLFEDSIIYSYADEADPTAFLPGFMDDIVKQAPSVVNKSSILIENIKNSGDSKIIGSTLCVNFGITKDAAADNLPDFLLQKDGMLDHHGERYIVCDGVGYSSKELEWYFLFEENEVVTMISSCCVAVRNGGECLKSWLNDEFLHMAFTEEERAMIIADVTLLTEEEIEKTTDKKIFANVADRDESQKFWWLGSMGNGALQRVVRPDGSVYNTGYNNRQKKCGVRPVIRLKLDTLKKLTN